MSRQDNAHMPAGDYTYPACNVYFYRTQYTIRRTGTPLIIASTAYTPCGWAEISTEISEALTWVDDTALPSIV
jgi:hypothetical protein